MNTTATDVIICNMDITNEWITPTNEPGRVIMCHEYTVGDIRYTVDGKRVVLHPSQHEIDIAVALCQRYQKTVELIPRINYPTGVQTPDYLINGEKYDLKAPTGKGRYLLQGLVAKQKHQAHNFIIDISNCPLNMDELERQSHDLFRSPRTAFLNILVFVRNYKVIKVLQRKQ